METTKNKISPETKRFFDKLSNYLDTQLYFYGSVQRDDYYSGYSDIDVDIFVENENSAILKLQDFLRLDRSKFKRVVNRVHTTNQIVYGYKVKYKRPGINVEFSIYNEKDKTIILREHNSKSELPYFISLLLIILKFIYYRIGLLPTSWYVNTKNGLMNSVNQHDAKYVMY